MLQDLSNTRLTRLVNFLRDNNLLGSQVFNCTGIDPTITIYDSDDIIVKVNDYYEFVEILGLSDKEYKSIIENRYGFPHLKRTL